MRITQDTLQTIVDRQAVQTKAIKRNKQACKSMRKAQRILRCALKASNTAEIKMLLGMARIAVEKAETLVAIR